MTDMTYQLVKYQFFCRNNVLYDDCDDYKFNIVNFSDKLKLDNDAVIQFFPAGHVPGAMMTLVEFKGKRILYTGDYSFQNTPLTMGCIFSYGMDIDTLIICGLHANHPYYLTDGNQLKKFCIMADRAVHHHKNIWFCTKQLTKGLELIKYLNTYLLDDIPIYIEDSLLSAINNIEDIGIPVLNTYFSGMIISASAAKADERIMFLMSIILNQDILVVMLQII